MPAYDRFWDLQIASDSAYDWKEEIVQNCIYQRETKKLNNVKGKALLALPLLSNVEVTVAACLNRLPKVEVVIYMGNFDTAPRLTRLMLDMADHLQTKALLLDSTVPSIVKKNFAARLKSVVKLLDESPADNKAIVISAEGSRFSLKNMPIVADRDIVIVDVSARPSLKLLESDPQIGYLSTTVNMADIASGHEQEYGREMVTWILGGGKAKIRITCHGDGEGYLEMKDGASKLHSLRADSIGKWLCANGLTAKRNLEVINVNICMGAKCNLTPAVIKSGAYTAAEGSAVELLARSLGEAGVHGIKVTGSNEVVAGIEAKELPDLTPVGDKKLEAGQGVRKIQIPDGFPFDSTTLTMTIPLGWSVGEAARSDSKLFTIKSPDNWLVTKDTSVFTRPVDPANAAYKFTSPTGGHCTIPSEGWIVDGKSVLSAEGWVSAGPGRLQFKGTGGTIAVDGRSEQKAILERLAKSKAKAVAIS